METEDLDDEPEQAETANGQTGAHGLDQKEGAKNELDGEDDELESYSDILKRPNA